MSRPKNTRKRTSASGLAAAVSKQEAGELVLTVVAELSTAMLMNHWGRAHRLLVVAEKLMTGREASQVDLCRNRPTEDADIAAAVANEEPS